jgi:hypothetical protein
MMLPRWTLAGAVGIYVLLACAAALPHRGLQYDEALMVVGAVQMLHSPEMPPVPYDPDTWQCVGGRCFPLMTVRYVGAWKEYLTLPAVAAFGALPEVIRVVTILWSALAVWGAGRLGGAWAAWLLAIAPSFAAHTAFDNGAVAGWMGALGLVFLFLARYREKGRLVDAAAAGAAAGLGLWCRANFAWLVAAALVAFGPALWRWARGAPRHAVAALAGGFVGSVPFWWYQLISRGGTFQALDMFRAEGTWAELLTARAGMLARTLLADLEHRAIWDGAALPAWQTGFVAVLFAAAVGAALLRPGLPRGAAVTAMGFLALQFSSRLPVAEHHFVLLLPLAAVVAALGMPERRGPRLALAIPYAVLALLAQAEAITGLQRTGGTGQWSDAVADVQETLEREFAGRPVRILDWGLQNSLFVLSGARLRTVEDFGTAWEQRLAEGGLFLLNGPENTFYAGPRETFVAAMGGLERPVRRLVFRQRSGAVFAELYDVPADPVIRIPIGSAAAAGRLSGFHALEENGWRWTERRFAVTVEAPGAGPRQVELDAFLPGPVFARLGPVLLQVRVGNAPAGSVRLGKPGPHRLTLPLPELPEGPMTIRFELDKALAPTGTDVRELGLIVQGIRVAPAGQNVQARDRLSQ